MSTEIKSLNGYPLADEAVREQLKTAPADMDVVAIDGGNRIAITFGNGSVKSVDVKDGEKGDTGEQGPQGEKGEPGAAGVSVTVQSVSESFEDGGSNVITFSDGHTLRVRNGSKGSAGAQGPQGEIGPTGLQGEKGEPGKDGVSATHSWNGTVLTITSASGTSSADLKGEKGDAGSNGSDGYTPVRGVDYWTEADKAEMVSAVISALPDASEVSY